LPPARTHFCDVAARGRRLLGAGEDVLELHHAGIGEQQGVVALRHQRGGRLDGVARLLEIIEEAGADGVHARQRS
jgi:hypothetical protein